MQQFNYGGGIGDCVSSAAMLDQHETGIFSRRELAMNLLSQLSSLSLYVGQPHACPYLPEQFASTMLVDPYRKMTMALYDLLLQQGFRRSGEYVYKPGCEACSACISLRIPVARFIPSRGQRRVLKRHQNGRLLRQPAQYNQFHFDMYKRYLLQRHHDSDMCYGNTESYMEFLSSSWSQTEFIEFRDDDDRCFAVSVVDVTTTALSAVYTFFDPDYARFSPGQLAILRLIELARDQGKTWLYLGYWIEQCRKMSYKTNYVPQQKLIGNQWL